MDARPTNSELSANTAAPSIDRLSRPPGFAERAAPSAPLSAPGQNGDLLRADLSAEADAIVVTLRGEVDVSSVSTLDDALWAAADNHPRVVVDMAGLTFIDSTGLNCLVSHHQRGFGELVLRAPPAHTRRLLAIAGLDSILSIL